MNNKLPAFQSTDTNNQGMELRDYFAAKAMQANLMTFNEFYDEHWKIGLAMDSYQMADAILKVRGAKEQ